MQNGRLTDFSCSLSCFRKQDKPKMAIARNPEFSRRWTGTKPASDQPCYCLSFQETGKSGEQ